MAVGLGSMDMPVPSVAEWAWLNWKFPRAVHAGETIYARWTLTQKRAPVGESPTAIAVWRVDVHTVDGALCAEGEIGASVMRATRSAQSRQSEPAAKARIDETAAPAASNPAAAPRRGRRRRRTPAGDGTKTATATRPAKAVEPPAKAPAAAPAGPERSASGTRRRRRRRSPASGATRNGDAPLPAAALAVEAPSSTPVATTAAAPGTANPLTRAIRRLRGSAE